jgi:hypothetical protein
MTVTIPSNGESPVMKQFKRISLLALVLLPAIALLPATLGGYFASSDLPVSPAYAPVAPIAVAPQGNGTEVEVFVRNFEFTQSQTQSTGGPVRNRP